MRPTKTTRTIKETTNLDTTEPRQLNKLWDHFQLARCLIFKLKSSLNSEAVLLQHLLRWCCCSGASLQTWWSRKLSKRDRTTLSLCLPVVRHKKQAKLVWPLSGSSRRGCGHTDEDLINLNRVTLLRDAGRAMVNLQPEPHALSQRGGRNKRDEGAGESP